ncbi:MAG: methyltransferase domain-containing protein [Acidobacteriota bacterium]
MTAPTDDLRAYLERLRPALAASSKRFSDEHEEALERWRGEISRAVGEAVEGLRHHLDDASGADDACLELGVELGDYIDWLQWTFWDLPTFAVVLDPDPARFRRAVAGCGLIYLAMRLLDDQIDRHFIYRGRRPTLLAARAGHGGDGRRAEAQATLSAVLLAFEGLETLAAASDEPADGDDDAPRRLQEVVSAARKTLTGALVEITREAPWDTDAYERLVAHKNVDYWRLLWLVLDPRLESALHPLLARHAALAQKINDVQDVAADARRAQPNVLLVHHAESGRDDASSAWRRAGDEIARDLVDLSSAAEELPAGKRAALRHLLAQSLDEVDRLGLFAPRPSPADGATGEETDSMLIDLDWSSSLAEIVDVFGPDALNDPACALCGAPPADLHALLDVAGFRLRRCASCDHVDAAPRLKTAPKQRLDRVFERLEPLDDPFVDVQRIYAEALTRRLLRESGGGRLLDIGYGGGHLLRLASAAGFEVYGVEVSPHQAARAAPAFGRRLRLVDDSEPLPWGAFDVVVLSHVLEHQDDPAALLRRIFDRLVPGGLLYVAVPDLESLHFRLLGARWNAINPLAHLHYFHQATLHRLLTDTGFVAPRRLDPPAFRPARATGWMRLFRRLGGDEAGELAMLARRGD